MALTRKERIKIYLVDVWFLWAMCLIFNIITFLFIYFKIHPGNRTLALRYNVLAGVEWYGHGKNLYFLPGVGLAVSAVNFVLYRALKDDKTFLSYLTVFVSLCVQLILFTGILFLAKVN